MQRRNREIVIFNLSAIDLFCSGMGAVMVLMVLLMPYYRKQAPVPAPVPAPVAVVTPPPLEKAVRIRATDVVFVMDATMSMKDELNAVRDGMTSIVQVLRRLSDEVNVGFVTYIDREVPLAMPPCPVMRGASGDANVRRLLQAIADIELKGNADWPEDVCAGLAKTASMAWPEAGGDRRQIMVLIGDARTHPEDHDRSLAIVRQWIDAAPNRSVNAVHTGSPRQDRPDEFPAATAYFKEVAAAGKGQYLENQGDLLGSILDILIIP